MDTMELLERMKDIIEAGSTLPPIALYEDNPEQEVFLSETVVGKRVVIIGVPGAFTPECSTVHLPGYVNNADILKEQGIDEIICISVNDPFVMKAWSDKQNASGKVRLLADTCAEFTLAIGLATDLPILGGIRSRRYSMVVYNEKVVHLKVELDSTSLKCSLVEALEFPNLNDKISEDVLTRLQHDTISLSVCVNIVDVFDDVVLPAKEFFNCFPQRDMKLNAHYLARKVAAERFTRFTDDLQIDATFVKNILERIISDTVFHKKFSTVAKITPATKTGDYYVQYKSIQNRASEQNTGTPLEEEIEKHRKEDIMKFLTRPKLSTLAGTLHDIVTDSVHETFRLDTQFSSESDHHIIDKNENLISLITHCRGDGKCPCAKLKVLNN